MSKTQTTTKRPKPADSTPSSPSFDQHAEVIPLLVELLKQTLEQNRILQEQNQRIIALLEKQSTKESIESFGCPAKSISLPIEAQIDRACRNKDLEQMEIQQRESKKNNLVLVGFDESKSEDEVAKMLKEWIESCSGDATQIEQVFRMGKPRGASEKPRPIKVKINDRDTKFKLYNCYQKLKGSGAFFRPDLTELQRNLLNKTRKACADLRSKTGDDLIVQINFDGKFVLKKREVNNGKRRYVYIGDTFEYYSQVVLGNDF